MNRQDKPYIEGENMAKDKIFMGVDQSLTGTGITVKENNKYTYYLIGTKKTKDTKCPSIDYTKRLKKLVSEVEKYIDIHNPDMICIEGMSYGSTGAVVFESGGLSHMFRSLFLDKGIPFIIAPPTVIKKFWTGKGNADKLLMVQTAELKGVEIPFTERLNKETHLNNNVVDAHAMCEFLERYEEYLDKIECSWDQ